MAKYKITGPDGNSYLVNAPDTASMPEVLEYSKKNYVGAKPKESTGLSKELSDFANKGDILADMGTFARKPFDYAGEKVAEFGGSKGFPRAAAGIGTAIKMIPDIAVGGMSKAGVSKVPALENISRNFAQRAIGFTKRLLSSPQARRKAAMAAETALENNIIPLSGNPATMMDRARQLSSRTGKGLQDIREAAGKQDIKPVIDSLESLKSRFIKGSGGEWEIISNRINHAINTVKGIVKKGSIEAAPEIKQASGLLDPAGREVMKTIPAVQGYVPPAGINKIEEAKKVLADTVNWLTDTPGRAKQMKSVVGSIEGGVESILRKTGTDMNAYQKLKKTYGAAEAMKMALNNELSSATGNQLLSMKPAIVASGALATGNPILAAGTALGGQLVKNRGAGFAANLIRQISRAKSGRLIPASAILRENRNKNLR